MRTHAALRVRVEGAALERIRLQLRHRALLRVHGGGRAERLELERLLLRELQATRHGVRPPRGRCAHSVGASLLDEQLALTARDALDPLAVEAFAGALLAMGDQIGRLAGYRNTRVRRIAASFSGAIGAIPIREYLAHARECSAVLGSEEQRFAELVVAMTTPDDPIATEPS